MVPAAAALRFLLLVLLWVPMARPAAADPLTADVSTHLIAITTGFTGSDVVLFGATDGPGDIVVLVRGPEGQATVRRKGRVAGFWVNVESVRFERVPAYFAIAATRPVTEFTSPAVRQREQFGTTFLRFDARREPSPDVASRFREALIRRKIDEGLYSRDQGQVRFLGERLFRANIRFPANVPTGTYTVDVFLVRDGEVVAAQATPLVVSKIGVGADMADIAHRYAALYGIIAVLVAAVAGWLAGIIFRRN
ncbi:TIGR02186 family protein [Stella sp.]|uniref:TIGR02186 family protein n=1 Tax=Stella sp. TaxID=2912054 RepID=UPI0035B0D97C